jgi:YD repeat-containing protein
MRPTVHRRRAASAITLLGTTSYGYDTTTGEVATIADALSHTTSMTFDGDGNKTGEATPDGHCLIWETYHSGFFCEHQPASISPSGEEMYHSAFFCEDRTPLDPGFRAGYRQRFDCGVV